MLINRLIKTSVEWPRYSQYNCDMSACCNFAHVDLLRCKCKPFFEWCAVKLMMALKRGWFVFFVQNLNQVWQWNCKVKSLFPEFVYKVWVSTSPPTPNITENYFWFLQLCMVHILLFISPHNTTSHIYPNSDCMLYWIGFSQIINKYLQRCWENLGRNVNTRSTPTTLILFFTFLLLTCTYSNVTILVMLSFC